jgi:hypothetical protein
MKEQLCPQQTASAGVLIQKLVRQWGAEGKMQKYRAWQVWSEVVGPQIAARAHPTKIREGVLEICVDRPVWMQQLQLLKPKILARLNKRLGEDVIKDIFLRQGKIKNEPTKQLRQPSNLPWHTAVLTSEEKAHIEAALKPLIDPEMRNGLRNILTRQAKLAKARKEQLALKSEPR